MMEVETEEDLVKLADSLFDNLKVKSSKKEKNSFSKDMYRLETNLNSWISNVPLLSLDDSSGPQFNFRGMELVQADSSSVKAGVLSSSVALE